jgi:hypothetical protein
MRWGRLVFSGLGILATCLAVAIVFSDAVSDVLVSDLNVPLLLVGTGLGMVGVGAVVAWMVGFRSSPTETAYDIAIESPPEDVQQSHGVYSAEPVQAEFVDASAGDPDAMDAIVRRLRKTAVTIYTVSSGVTRDDATNAVDAGIWTDDRTAAAMLAADKSQPITARLRLWLDPERERERRIERTIEAIRRLNGEKQ